MQAMLAARLEEMQNTEEEVGGRREEESILVSKMLLPRVRTDPFLLFEANRIHIILQH